MDRLILSLLIINFAIYSYSNAFFFLAPYLAGRGYSAASAGILVGVFYAATTAVRPVGSWITERIGVRKSIKVDPVVKTKNHCIFNSSEKEFRLFNGNLSGFSTGVDIPGCPVVQ